MAKLSILPKLTKSYILERVTQEEIMEKYLGEAVTPITLTANSMTSPFREDKSPSCSYRYNEHNRLRFIDWTLGESYDALDIAGKLGADKPINARTKQGFQLILNIIAKDFAIHKYTSGVEREKLNTYIQVMYENPVPKVFSVVSRVYTKADYDYWFKNYDISIELLKKAKVFPVEELHIEKADGYLHQVYRYNKADPAYAYLGGKENGILIWKIYFPLRKKGKFSKFMTNKAFVQGMKLFQPARVGIITKSYKDVLCLNTFGLQAIAVAAEGVLPSPETYFKFSRNFDITISLMDYDPAGILMANKLKHTYGTTPIMFTRGRYSQPDYGVKDFTDFRQAFGRRKTIDLINYVLDINKDSLNYFDTYNYNSLKNIK